MCRLSEPDQHRKRLFELSHKALIECEDPDSRFRVRTLPTPTLGPNAPRAGQSAVTGWVAPSVIVRQYFFFAVVEGRVRQVRLLFTLIGALFLTSMPLPGGDGIAQGTLACGLRPLPEIGCRIGRCVDGHWEQICDRSPTLSCGIKPVPNVGCRIGRCVSRNWEQICDSAPTLSCGLKPIPRVGCRIGRCVDGRWEQVCG